MIYSLYFPFVLTFACIHMKLLLKVFNLFYSWNTQLTWSVAEATITTIIITQRTETTVIIITTVIITTPGILLKSNGVIKMLTTRLGPVS